ncbi:hypothetical protein K439DRAFT_404999 [Ramaria rubella]|nr:hypothetical protein K439DRAFT_404999 [Ramaria rubella]
MTPRSPALTLCNFGMWRATFRCHVEDMDLSRPVNYIHFRNIGTPSSKDARKRSKPQSKKRPGPARWRVSRHLPAWLPRRNFGFNCTENFTLALKSWNEVELRGAFCVQGGFGAGRRTGTYRRIEAGEESGG